MKIGKLQCGAQVADSSTEEGFALQRVTKIIGRRVLCIAMKRTRRPGGLFRAARTEAVPESDDNLLAPALGFLIPPPAKSSRLE